MVANGGIRTEAESRVEMNLDAMEPSLVLMRRDGTLLSKETLAQQMNSVRHLAVGSDGTIAACQQFMGDAHETAELLAIKRPGEPFKAFRCPSDSCSRWPSTPPASPSTATCAWWR